MPATEVEETAIEQSQVGDETEPVEVVSLTTEEEQENTASAIINNLVYEQGMFLYDYNNVLSKYSNLTNQQFSSLIWPFRYYNEIFDSAEDTYRLDQTISDGIQELNEFTDEKRVKQHKIFKNILFNITEVAVLRGDSFEIMSYGDLQQLYVEENSFYLARFQMGQKIKNSLLTLFGSNTSTNFSKHSQGYKYFIVSSEPINFSDYKEILPQSRDNENWVINNFDNIETDLPELTNETDISFTYMKSNYVKQSVKGNMNLKGIRKELSTTETSNQVGTTTVENSGY
jgi:hypothetical protein